jgi:drug/metabolite transporter (DMT)-like permease
MTTSWFWLAILAAMFWGLTYVLNEYMLRFLDPFTVFFLSAFFIAIILGVYLSFTHNWQEIIHKFSGNYTLIGATIGYILFYLIAGTLILKSIEIGNASLAAIIESAYPVFTMPFAYLILREVQFNWGTVAGITLIFNGPCCSTLKYQEAATERTTLIIEIRGHKNKWARLITAIRNYQIEKKKQKQLKK